MDGARFLKIACSGVFWSNVAGVAYQAICRYTIGYLEIDNYHSDLSEKKGLPLSAAICVLMARAMIRLYDLHLNVNRGMDPAYHGEITTPSRCGRMDL
jgi:galactokinase